MSLFEDYGFDSLPKIPVPGRMTAIQTEITPTPVTIPAMQAPVGITDNQQAPRNDPPGGAAPEGDRDQKAGWKTLVFMTIAIVAIVGAFVYLEERNAKKNIKRIDGSGGF